MTVTTLVEGLTPFTPGIDHGHTTAVIVNRIPNVSDKYYTY
jgi:hypothetical protein